jgi:hypothetical protein
MTLALILISSVIVWLNRGLYDPSVPILVAFFLAWSYAVFNNRKWLSESKRYLFLLPWIWAALFVFRTDLLYVADAKKEALTLLRFFPLLSVAIYTLDQKVYGAHPRAIRSLPLFFIILLLVPFLSPEPKIDVFLSNRLGAHFLLQGANPYNQIYPDVYQGQYDYHPGFLYWPGALLLQTISEFVFRDIRIILILAWIAGAFLLKTRKNYLVAWFTLPFLSFAFEQGWLDPLISLGGVLALYGLRTKKNIWWVVGVVLAATVKQYGFMVGLFSVLYFVLLNGIPKVRGSLLAMITGFLIIVAPFVYWDPHAFLDMTVLSHISAKVRPDALNFTAFWFRMTGDELASPVQLAFILLGLLIAVLHVVQNHLRRGLRCVPEAWAIFFGFSVFFGKFAFCNYYLLLISFWLMAESEGDDYLLQKL